MSLNQLNTKRINTIVKVNSKGDTVITYRRNDLRRSIRYFGSFEREGAGLKVHTAEGFYDAKEGRHYQYIRNRQGSTMAVVNDSGVVVQRTGYYATGTPFVLPVDAADSNGTPALDGVTDRLHIGNRRMGLSGLAMYDNSARVHDPVMPHFLTCDSRAGDYSWLSPFSHCAGNPANLSDNDGNRIKLNGTAEDIKLTLNLLQNSVGNYYNLSSDSEGMVTWEATGAKVSRIQEILSGKLTKMLESDTQMELNIVNESTEDLIGTAGTSTIDIGDILNALSNDVVSPISFLWHELAEQWIIQQVTPDASTASEALKWSAHNSACNLESRINGKYVFIPDDRDTNNDKTELKIGYKEPLKDCTLYITIQIMNNNIDTNRP